MPMPNGFPRGVNCIGRATSVASMLHFRVFGIALRGGVLFNA